MPSATRGFSWLRPTSIRRMRKRAPTCVSIGLGAFFIGGLFQHLALARRTLRDIDRRPQRTTCRMLIHTRFTGNALGGAMRRSCATERIDFPAFRPTIVTDRLALQPAAVICALLASKARTGGVAERLKAHALKECMLDTR